MSKWEEASPETVKLFDDVLIKIDLEQYGVKVKIVGDNDQPKKVIKRKKLTGVLKYLVGADILFTVNQEILSALPPVEQNLCIIEAITPIWYNTERDALVIDPEDVKTSSGFLRKYGYEKFEVLEESIKTLYEVKKEKDAAQKDD